MTKTELFYADMESLKQVFYVFRAVMKWII